MLSIQLPHISVENVSNGYVVQWQEKNPDNKSAERYLRVEAVCTDIGELLGIIENAAASVAMLAAEWRR